MVLNGAPRSGKSSIAAALAARTSRIWLRLGVDLHSGHVIPERLRPGVGLRPGGERPELEALLPRLYASLYDSLAAHSRQGFAVVADLGHHDDFTTPLGLLPSCARRLDGLPAFLVGVRCPLETIMERRRAGGDYLSAPVGEPVPPPVLRWQDAVHRPGIYDLEVDTSAMTPQDCADAVEALAERPQDQASAFRRLARP